MRRRPHRSRLRHGRKCSPAGEVVFQESCHLDLRDSQAPVIRQHPVHLPLFCEWREKIGRGADINISPLKENRLCEMMAENPASYVVICIIGWIKWDNTARALPDNQISTDLEKNPEFACILDNAGGSVPLPMIAFCTDKFDEEFR